MYTSQLLCVGHHTGLEDASPSSSTVPHAQAAAGALLRVLAAHAALQAAPNEDRLRDLVDTWKVHASAIETIPEMLITQPSFVKAEVSH